VLTVTLFAPDLLGGPEPLRPALAAHPALYRWLCRARCRTQPAAGAHAALGAWFGLERMPELPHAALSLLGTGADPGDACWLHADPAHLLAQRAELVLMDAQRLEIQPAESAALTDALNTHFAQDGLRFHAPTPACWYARTDAELRLRTVPLADALGRSVDALLPQGDDALVWHRRLNEAQMLLHAHPVNIAREARGALTINSLWLWGTGRLPLCNTAFAAAWGDDAGLRGMARRAEVADQALPADATAWLRNATAGAHLIALNAPAGGEASQAIEATLAWIQPLRAAIADARVGEATLSTYAQGQRMDWTLARADRWKFWRRDPQLPVSPRGVSGA
jgi:hypothetical protein